jgi:eukaryotic-like serine/threonine-protein kinase
VYAAHDRLLERDVAIKFVRTANDPVERARFAGEARLLAGLAHPALVTVYDASFDGDQPPHLIFRLIDGGTLRQRINDHGPLTRDRVARIGARLATALAHVHEHGIVHRDVKPSNVLIDSTEACYLADFGLAWSLGSSRVTNSGEMAGTACYLAPEQVAGAVVDQKADVYALGLVLLECLTGRTQYRGTEVEAAVARLSRQPVVPERLGTSWRHLLTAMTAYDPADRPDAAEAAHQLEVLTRPQSSTQDMPGRNAAPGVNDTGKRTTAVPLAHRVGREWTTSRSWARPRRTTKVRTALGVVGAAAMALIVATTGSTGTAGKPIPDSAPRASTATPAQPAETPRPTRADTARPMASRAATPNSSVAARTQSTAGQVKVVPTAKAGKPASKPHKGRATDARDRRGKSK